MLQQKFLVMLAVSAIISTPVISSICIKANTIIDTSNLDTYDIPQSHLIEGVPYIGQETNFYCGYATATMILKYLGINATLDEVVYNSGVGYSLMYPSFKDNRLPFSGWILSQERVTCEFLSDLYGTSFYSWENPENSNFEEIWEEYWVLIKENISKNLPVGVVVEESTLFTQNLGFKILSQLTDTFQIVASHFLLLIGYNETNNTVCFNDPVYDVLNIPQLGKYRWVSLDKFKTSSKKVLNILYVKIFEDNDEDPLSKQDAFNHSHKRNIEKLKGNFSVYFDEFSGIRKEDNYSLGINATKELKKEFEKGLNNRIKTAYYYKFNNRLGIFYYIMDYLYSKHPELIKLHHEEIILEPNAVYRNIATEKKYAANYLREIKNNLTCERLIKICDHEATLFEYEAENWTKIADNYSEFRKKGIFMFLPRALNLLDIMEDIFDDIISIEEAILDGPFEI